MSTPVPAGRIAPRDFATTFKNSFEASIDNLQVSWAATPASGLSIVFGKFDSPLAIERDDAPLNFQATPSFVFDFARPVKFTGLMARDTFSPQFEGYAILAPIPSCTLMFKQELPLMFPDNGDLKRVSEAMFDPFEYLSLRHRDGLLKTDFKQALDFVNRVGAIAEQEGHHPDILLAWGKAEITMWTHKIDGLTHSDFVMAAKIDQLSPA